MNFKYSPRFLRIFCAQRFMKSYQFLVQLDFPVLSVIGESDEIFSVETVRAFLDEAPSENKELLVISGANYASTHDLCSTPLINWLKKNFE